MVQLVVKTVDETPLKEIERIFNLQKENQFEVARTTVKERKKKLDIIHRTILKYRDEIKEALYKDYQKHPAEVDLTEIYPITTEAKHAKSDLFRWMDKQKVSTPIALMGSSSYIHHEPKGVVLIISPWNFPMNLTFGPLVSAIAAGNCVIIKPSEMTPHASALMKKMVEDMFDENEVAVVEGGVGVSTELLAQPFNHIFFTGSPQVGKIVMKAAAEHLCSVTLELGGKSPTIVDESAILKQAAQRIAWGKFINNGQICIAPDYAFVHESRKEEFIDLVKQNIETFYTKEIQSEPSYNRIVNVKHYKRIKESVADAVSKGAQVMAGGVYDDVTNYYAPTVLTNAPDDSRIMEEEIFGPVLPVIGYSDIEDVIAKINARPKPLALYIYSKNKKNINQIIDNTRAGGTCINHNAAHFFNTNLPFGGSNNSGIGKAHGYEGFKSFSNSRGVLKQHMPNALEMLMPPYNDFKQKLINFTIKYF